jgi:peptidoglycan hydrolase-like protein with peptidoglycan-binding domain
MSAVTDYWSSKTITSTFGAKRPNGRKHRGTDYHHARGRRVPSPVSGTVVSKLSPATWHGFGYQVSVRLANGIVVSFSHLNGASPLAVGAKVSVNTTLGYEGTTGFTTGPCTHVEVNDNGFRNPAPYIAAWIAQSTASPSQPAKPVKGNSGNKLYPVPSRFKDVQNGYRAIGYDLVADGYDGPKTKAVVKDFQKRHGLKADGIHGSKTEAKLVAVVAASKKPKPSGKPVLRRGSKGAWVGNVQRRLKTNYPAYAGRLAVDNDFGPGTEKAVREFQRRSGLKDDGIVGDQTYKKLGL